MATMECSPCQSKKKPLVRRTDKDVSQLLRRWAQAIFLILNLWIGVQFFFFVRQFESGVGSGWTRPAGVEGWLPIAGMMNSKYLFLTGEIPAIHPAAMFLFLIFVGLSLLLRKAFCGWLCPVGTVSEYLWKFGRSTFRRNWRLPRWADIPLRGLKYLVLGFFVYAVGFMSAESIAAFLRSPYGIVADVRMLNFFRYLTGTAAIVLAVLLIGSVFVRNLWCRYLCPYGALMGLAALASPLRIKRNPERCIDCAKCAKACPSHLPVDTLIQIRSAECIGCMECIAVCPADYALGLSIPGAKPRYLHPRAVAAVIAIVFFGVVGYAKLSGHWESPIPDIMYQRLIPIAAEVGHP
ncbi:MAG: 4Fe-4S binding protein [Acidobacteria bacterium]|nr:4Fe-4S binding protein [Acidobacteriota bacterium]